MAGGKVLTDPFVLPISFFPSPRFLPAGSFRAGCGGREGRKSAWEFTFLRAKGNSLPPAG